MDSMKILVLEAFGLHLGYLGCYGNDWLATPAFDQLAAEAFVFDQHFADGLKQLGSFPLSLNLKITAHALRDQLRALFGRPPHYVPVIGPLTFATFLAPNHHYGVDSVRDVAYDYACTCLKYASRRNRT